MVKTRTELDLDGIKVVEWLPTGSRYVVSPPVTNTDEDYVVLVEDIFEADVKLEERGFVRPTLEDESDYEQDDRELMFTYRKGDLNLIVVESSDFFNKWSAATYLAKKFNLAKKEDRVLLFKYILYGDI